MLPRNELPANHPLLGNPAFEGYRLFCNWRDLQPAEGTIDLSIIAEAANLVTPHGQKLLVSINFGKGAGEWIYSGKYPCTKFNFTMKGQPAFMPLGFEEAYQRKVDDFLSQLGRRFDADKSISGFVMTGSGTLGIEFHVVDQPQDIDAWEAAARSAGYSDKHSAIQSCALYRMDVWDKYFAKTTLLFCGGNPWSNQTGKADEAAAFDYAKNIPNGGICTEYLKGNPDFDENAGQQLDYLYTEEPVAPTSSPDSIQGTLPQGVSGVHCVLMTACNKGAQMCELWEEDCLPEANWETIEADGEKLISNVT